MLKFTNAEKTAADFNGTCFSLKVPEDWDSMGDGPTREAVLAWLDAGNAPVPADHPPAAIPVVSPWQFRKALNQTNLRQSVEDAVAASTDQDVKDGWEFATEFRRDDPLVIMMAAAVGVSESDLDSLFALAAAL